MEFNGFFIAGLYFQASGASFLKFQPVFVLMMIGIFLRDFLLIQEALLLLVEEFFFLKSELLVILNLNLYFLGAFFTSII